MRTRAAIQFAAAVYYAQVAAAEDDQVTCLDAASNKVAADKCTGNTEPHTFFLSRRGEEPVDSVEKRDVINPSRIKRGGFGTPTQLAARTETSPGSGGGARPGMGSVGG
ncbi:hypothetical protein PpBr36_03967 [Pyricularia pennisetigena]|uniref:hypothetical protein n=1 Tax=Pyricularia pennisetigena TaxID=1578925 RepID=UPI00114E6F6C|nr:hypothetical protein PpBr36_03967 [Pyricularia pennisetigena]TLS26114.1 hypothetical protein PpBr36_03967 [Pyricularia pennisetigena]